MTRDQLREEYFRAALEIYGVRNGLERSLREKTLYVRTMRSYLGDMLFLVDMAVETGKLREDHSPEAFVLELSDNYRTADHELDQFGLFLEPRRELLDEAARFAYVGSSLHTSLLAEGKLMRLEGITELKSVSRHLRTATNQIAQNYIDFRKAFDAASSSLPVSPVEYASKKDDFMLRVGKLLELERGRERRDLTLETFPGLRRYVLGA